MAASIRGHQTTVKFLKAGQPVAIVNLTRFEANQESTFSKAMYVGAQLPEGDQSMEGWSGTAEMEVKDGALDEFIDALVTNNLNGVGVEEVNIVDTEFYPDGQSQAYVYFDVQAKMSKSTGGLKDKVTKKLEWQASGRAKL